LGAEKAAFAKRAADFAGDCKVEERKDCASDEKSKGDDQEIMPDEEESHQKERQRGRTAQKFKNQRDAANAEFEGSSLGMEVMHRLAYIYRTRRTAWRSQNIATN
jgi:hypothetical protein